jgi:hypothetical protein
LIETPIPILYLITELSTGGAQTALLWLLVELRSGPRMTLKGNCGILVTDESGGKR